MLLILTGQIRTGKTTWLRARVGALEAAGVACYGVTAPGVWDGRGRKVAIDNELLPGQGRVRLARAADPAEAGGMAWDFDAAALARVNAHLAGLRGDGPHESGQRGGGLDGDGPHESGQRGGRPAGDMPREDSPHEDAPPTHAARPGLLVVDELGPLELRRGAGLTEALALLAEGPTPAWPHALVVVRAGLAKEAAALLGPTWGEVRELRPNEAGTELLTGVVLGARG